MSGLSQTENIFNFPKTSYAGPHALRFKNSLGIKALTFRQSPPPHRSITISVNYPICQIFSKSKAYGWPSTHFNTIFKLLQVHQHAKPIAEQLKRGFLLNPYSFALLHLQLCFFYATIPCFPFYPANSALLVLHSV